MWRLLLVLMATAAVAFLAPMRVAVACTCDTLPPGNPVDLAGRHLPGYDHAFIATIERIEDRVEVREGPDTGSFVPFIAAVEVTLAGDAPTRAIILQPSRADPNRVAADCSFGFVAGGRYLVEAREHSPGVFFTNGCTFTQPYGAQAAAVDGAGEAPPAATDPEPAGGWRGPLLAGSLVAVAWILVLVVTLRQRDPGHGDSAPSEPSAPTD